MLNRLLGKDELLGAGPILKHESLLISIPDIVGVDLILVSGLFEQIKKARDLIRLGLLGSLKDFRM